jgi:hypothetical protein
MRNSVAAVHIKNITPFFSQQAVATATGTPARIYSQAFAILPTGTDASL